MRIAPCPFCSLLQPWPGFFCSRCGGELQAPSALERVVFQLQTVRTLMRNRVWAGTTERVKAVQQPLEDDRSLARLCERTLIWLGQETNDLIQAEANLPRGLNLARAVLGILPAKTFPVFRARVGRLGAFLDALLRAEQEWKAAGAPAAKKIRTWFDNLLDNAQLVLADGRAYVYASPQRWPTVASCLDSAAYETNRILVYLASGEKKHKDKDYGAARKQYEAILAKRPKNIAALEGLAVVLAAIRDKPKAVECYREAIRLGTRESRSYTIADGEAV